MSDFARNVIFNADTGEITVDGETLPYFYGDARPALVTGEHGEAVPAIRLSIACTDLMVVAPSKLDDELEDEAVPGE